MGRSYKFLPGRQPEIRGKVFNENCYFVEAPT